MSIVSLAAAKLHLRVTRAVEDQLIQDKLDAAEESAAAFLKRRLYADADALATAVSQVPADLDAAFNAYSVALTAAYALPSADLSDLAVKAAQDAYSKARSDAQRKRDGIVLNKSILAAVLLLTGHLYANRESTTVQLIELPMGVRYLLNPFRVYG